MLNLRAISALVDEDEDYMRERKYVSPPLLIRVACTAESVITITYELYGATNAQLGGEENVTAMLLPLISLY